MYAAEVVLEAHARRTFQSVADVARRIETILRSRWVAARFIVWTSRVQVRVPVATRVASYRGNGMFVLPPWAWRDSVVLHEVAHMLERRRADSFMKVNDAYSWHIRIDDAEQAAHGPRFCQTYLQLVGRFIGRAAALDLEQAFDRKAVRYRRSAARRQRQVETTVRG